MVGLKSCGSEDFFIPRQFESKVSTYHPSAPPLPFRSSLPTFSSSAALPALCLFVPSVSRRGRGLDLSHHEHVCSEVLRLGRFLMAGLSLTGYKAPQPIWCDRLCFCWGEVGMWRHRKASPERLASRVTFLSWWLCSSQECLRKAYLWSLKKCFLLNWFTDGSMTFFLKET